MKKKGVRIVVLIILGTLGWYFFLKPSDYTIRFKARTFPGAINQTLKMWEYELDTVQKIQQNGDNILELEQRIQFGDSVHRYHWKIEALTDSTSKVRVNVTDENLAKSVMNKLQVPFKRTAFVENSEKVVLDFMEELKNHTEMFEVKVVGQEESPTKYLAYIPIETTQFKKAGGMMRNFNYLTGELFQNGVTLDGPPMLVVTHWNMENDSLHYDFAQPIIRSEKLPIGTDIKYRRIFSKPALKAIYNGNYITSDRAWYALLDYAKRNGIEVEPNPIEIFYNNPSGGDERNWKAEIYLPIKQDETR